MSLSQYKKKRAADETPEPFGGKAEGKELIFVVQKHAASHLHYDFRLEMEGVLKSWAVPKGPSMDPSVKRLAMMVEDHPYDYRTFEGIIPQGQYGGGTVIVWDHGTYEPLEPAEGKAARDKRLLQELKAGSIKFRLNGKKLKGEFALVKPRGMGENGWLLIKHDDKYATEADITLKGKSVVSKKTLEQVARTSDNIYGHPKKDNPAKKTAKKVATKKAAVAAAKKKAAEVSPELKSYVSKAPRQTFYETVQPMLATLTDKPFDDNGWVYEVKWDGYRALAFLNKGKAEIKSRNDKLFTQKYYPVAMAVEQWGINAIVDGEIVVTDEEGRANFGALQNWRSEADGNLVYYVFDILWHNGYDLTGLPLTDRKKILELLLPEGNDTIQLSKHFELPGTEFFKTAKALGLEGIMAKRKDSTYQCGMRNTDWLKIKANKRQEVVIGGYTKNKGTTKPFSALLVGVFEGNKFIYTGKIGTGFTIKTQKEMLELFEPLRRESTPFNTAPDINKPSRFRPDPPHADAYWLTPKLVCEVSFTEMTVDGVMRHPSFEGMRVDKKAREVLLEAEKPIGEILNKTSMKQKIVKAPGKRVRKTLLNPTEETQVKKVNGNELKFTNLDKLYWPKDKVTKRDMINYYYQVAPYMLPYLVDRPQSLNRYPEGIEGFSFYQKDVTGKAPDWTDVYLYDSDEGEKHYLLGNDEATILYMANLGCIEFHPWNSTASKPDYPTWCVIDLDPDKNTFEQVIETAQVTHDILDNLGVPSYCKTSGSTGLHIYIPLGAKYDYDQSKEFARTIVTLVNKELPRFTTLERTIADRKGKMYLDFLQNRAHATLAAPYSLRPKPGATVSMPLHWDEVKKGLKLSDFTIHNALDRLRSEGDIFKPVLGKGIDLRKVIAAFEKDQS